MNHRTTSYVLGTHYDSSFVMKIYSLAVNKEITRKYLTSWISQIWPYNGLFYMFSLYFSKFVHQVLSLKIEFPQENFQYFVN
jgi:hypothetical protein